MPQSEASGLGLQFAQAGLSKYLGFLWCILDTVFVLVCIPLLIN